MIRRFPFAVLLLALLALLAGSGAVSLHAQESPAAERALAEGRPGEAVEIYRAAAAERPDDPGAQALLGRTLALAERFGEAAEVLERAVELGAGDVRTLLYLGSALWESGDPTAADPTVRAKPRGT